MASVSKPSVLFVALDGSVISSVLSGLFGVSRHSFPTAQEKHAVTPTVRNMEKCVTSFHNVKIY